MGACAHPRLTCPPSSPEWKDVCLHFGKSLGSREDKKVMGRDPHAAVHGDPTKFSPGRPDEARERD